MSFAYAMRQTAHAGSGARARTFVLAIAIAAISVFAFSATASAHGWHGHPAKQLNYVSLGDSYAAGPGIPQQIAVDTVPGCAQSNANFAHLLAAMARWVKLTDVSCSGAVTANMMGPQVTPLGTAPPQFDKLAKNTGAVTVTIGGNDIGFTSIIGSCISPTPTGSPCQNLYVTPSGDALRQRVDALAPKLDAALDGIKARSPRARVVITGYPAILPDDGVGCWPTMPFTPSDTAYLTGVLKYLNNTIRQEARSHGAGYADTYAATLGHDACKPDGTRWIEPLQPTNPTATPVHPNAAGMVAFKGAVLKALWHPWGHHSRWGHFSRHHH